MPDVQPGLATLTASGWDVIEPREGGRFGASVSGGGILPGAGGLSALLFGDSITAMNGGASPDPSGANRPAANYYASNGYFTWANIEWGAPFRYITNLGRGSDTTALMLSRIDSDLGSGTTWDYGFVLAGINNFIVRGDTTPDATIADLASIWAKLRTRCQVLVGSLIWPTGSVTSGQRAALIQVNAWIVKNAANYGVTLMNVVTNSLVDPANATAWSYLSSFTNDNTHPNNAGACAAGHALARQFPHLKTLTRATPMDGNNLLSNGEMRGTNGSAPTGWSSAGSLSSWTYAARSDGEPGTTVTVTAADFANLWQTLFSGFTVGRRCVAEVEYACATASAKPNILVALSGGQQYEALRAASPDSSTWAIPASGVLRTPEFVIAAGTTSVQMFVQGMSAATWTFSRAVLRYVD